MKNLKTLCLISATAFLFACNNPNKDNSDMDRNTIESADGVDSASQNMVKDRDEDATQLEDNRYYPSTGDDRAAMYEDVGLSPDQIERFEDDYNRKVEDLKSHGRGTYDKQSIEATKDQSMRTITSDKEYQRYLDWKKSHPVVY